MSEPCKDFSPRACMTCGSSTPVLVLAAVRVLRVSRLRWLCRRCWKVWCEG